MPDEVQFKSPTTGKIQVVPPEHWDEAIKAGYQPTTHKVMYDPGGNRGMVPNAELHDRTAQGYVYDLKNLQPAPEEKSTYQRLTEPDQTTANPLARYASNIGARVFRAPQTAYESIEGGLKGALDPGRAALDLYQSSIEPWFHTSTWRGAPSVLPEALGMATGDVALGEAAGATPGAATAAARATGRLASRVARDPTTGALKPGAVTTSKVLGATGGAGVGYLGGELLLSNATRGIPSSGMPYGELGGLYGAYKGGRAGWSAGPGIAERVIPQRPIYPGAFEPSAADFYEQRGAYMNKGYKPGDPFAPDYVPTGAIYPSFEDFEQATRVAKPVPLTQSPYATQHEAAASFARGEEGPSISISKSPVPRAPIAPDDPFSPSRSASGGGGGGGIGGGRGAEPLILTPEQAQSLEQRQRIATSLASERGMQYAGGVRTAGPNRPVNRLFPQPTVVPSTPEPAPAPPTRFTPEGRVEQRVTPEDQPYPGVERRKPTLMKGVTTAFDLPSGGEQLGQELRTARAGPSVSERMAQEKYGKSFTELTTDQQQSLIAEYSRTKGKR